MDKLIELLYTAIYILGLTCSIIVVGKIKFKWKNVIYFLIYTVVLNLMTLKSHQQNVTIAFNTLCMLSDYLYCNLIIGKYKENTIYISILYFCSYGAMIIALTLLFTTIMNVQYINVMMGNYRALIPIIANGIAFLLCFLSTRKYNVLNQDLPKKYITQYFIIHLYAGIILTTLNTLLMQQYSSLMFVIVFLLILQMIVVNRYITKTNALHIKNKELTLLHYSKDIMLEHVKVVEEKNNEMSKFRHDMQNHLLIISQLNGDKEKVEKYISTLIKDIIKNKMIQTGNIFIDAILNQKIIADIDYSIDINVKEKLNIEDGKLCSLLCNLLDNANRAAIKSNDKKVQLKITSQYDMLFIYIENSVDKKVSFITDKGQNHGYGLAIINEIVAEYGGAIKCENKDDRVSFDIAMNEN